MRKKKEEEKVTQEIKKTDLKTICGDDKEVYEALIDTMFLDPRKVGISLKEAAKKAKEFKKSGDMIRTRMYYRMAGGLAISEGKVEKVIQCFGECKKLSPNENYKILENPEKAVQKAQEYYQKYLKPEEKK